MQQSNTAINGNANHQEIMASDIIRFVPVVFLVSPSLGREVALKIAPASKSSDTEVMSQRVMENPMLYDAAGLLAHMGLQKLLHSAPDWRYMTTQEIEECVARNDSDLEYPINRHLDEALNFDDPGEPS